MAYISGMIFHFYVIVEKKVWCIPVSYTHLGMNFSDYVRKAISDHPIIVVSGIQDLHLQVARVGNNLNQLVMLAHEGRITSVDLTECFEMLQMTYSKLSEISEVINHGDCDSGPG